MLLLMSTVKSVSTHSVGKLHNNVESELDRPLIMQAFHAGFSIIQWTCDSAVDVRVTGLSSKLRNNSPQGAYIALNYIKWRHS